LISVTPINVDDAAVIAGNTSGSANEGVVVTGTLTATDVEGLTGRQLISTVTGTLPSNGTAAIDASSGAWNFTPTDANRFGTDSFEVTVTDDLWHHDSVDQRRHLINVDDAAVIAGNTSGSANEGVW
jgi:hypothetical protein